MDGMCFFERLRRFASLSRERALFVSWPFLRRINTVFLALALNRRLRDLGFDDFEDCEGRGDRDVEKDCPDAEMERADSDSEWSDGYGVLWWLLEHEPSGGESMETHSRMFKSFQRKR